MSTQKIIDTLTFANGGMGETFTTINEGDFNGITFKFGKVWFPGEDQPILSFEYDVISMQKPIDTVKFETLIGEILYIMLRKALTDQEVVYSGGTDESVKSDVPKEESKILTPWDYKVPEPEPGTVMSKNLFNGFR